MASAKAILGKVLGPLLFKSGAVTGREALSPHFVKVHCEGAGYRGAAFEAGDKVQAFIEGEGMRTYSPIDWDAGRGAFDLVLYLREATTPGVTWSRTLSPGAKVSVFGPQRSVRAGAPRPVVLFGDETSVGVARALHSSLGGKVRTVFEATDDAEVTSVVTALGLDAHVVRRAGDTHFTEIAGALARAAQATQGEILLTGAAPSIQAVQRALKAQGLRASGTRAYWSPGKVGLD